MHRTSRVVCFTLGLIITNLVRLLRTPSIVQFCLMWFSLEIQLWTCLIKNMYRLINLKRVLCDFLRTLKGDNKPFVILCLVSWDFGPYHSSYFASFIRWKTSVNVAQQIGPSYQFTKISFSFFSYFLLTWSFLQSLVYFLAATQ